jgi:broad specificity phosphatase PhoE
LVARRVPAETRIVTSPLARARATAHRIAAELGGSRVALDPRWREADFGLAEGLTFTELERRWPELASRLVHDDPAIDWPGGEAHASLAARVSEAIGDLGRTGGTWVVVTHGGPLRLAVALATGTELARVPLPAPAGVVDLSIPDRFDPAGSSQLRSRRVQSVQRPGSRRRPGGGGLLGNRAERPGRAVGVDLDGPGRGHVDGA